MSLLWKRGLGRFPSNRSIPSTAGWDKNGLKHDEWRSPGLSSIEQTRRATSCKATPPLRLSGRVSPSRRVGPVPSRRRAAANDTVAVPDFANDTVAVPDHEAMTCWASSDVTASALRPISQEAKSRPVIRALEDCSQYWP